MLIEFIAIGSAYFIVESKNKSQQAALSDLVAKISQQNTYISELQNLPSVISSNAQRISDTEGNLRLVTENFNELKNEVGNHKVDLLAQQFNLLTHKLETLEETKNQEVLALSVATVGNTLGSMTSYVIGRLFPKKVSGRAIEWFERWGVWALLFAWLPVVGDALPVAAGWLRIGWVKSLIFILIGKALRYSALALGFSQLF